MEVLPLTLQRFASSLALLIHPTQALCSSQACGSGQVSPVHTLEGAQAPGLRSYPCPRRTQPSTQENNVETVLLSQGLCISSLPHSPLQAGSSATLVWSPQVGQQRSPWSLGSQDSSVGANHALQLSPSQFALKT